MAGAVQSPEKELRFTRSGQAALFWVAAAFFMAVSVTMAAISYYRQEPHPLLAVVPLLPAAGLLRLAVRLTRHAYLILTPLGIEIFPFFRPASGMRLVVWQEVDSAEVDPGFTVLTLHHDAAKTSGIHISLRPIRAELRPLLAKAVIGRADSGKSSGFLESPPGEASE